MKRKKVEKKYLYICNQQRCEDCSADLGLCRHTTSIRFAANYVPGSQINEEDFIEKAPGIFMEIDHEERSVEEANKECLH